MKSLCDEVCGKADVLYRNRGNVDGVEESIKALSLCTNSVSDYGVQWRLSRASFFLGQEEIDKANKINHFRNGIKSGKHAVKLSPELVEGHFWFAVNLSLCAEQIGAFTALRYIRQALRHLEISRKISPGYHGAGPLRILGRLRHKLPWPLGSRNLSESLFKQALELSPDNSVTRIFFSDLLCDLGRRDAERQELATILKLPEDPNWDFELARDKKIASKRLNDL